MREEKRREKAPSLVPEAWGYNKRGERKRERESNKRQSDISIQLCVACFGACWRLSELVGDCWSFRTSARQRLRSAPEPLRTLQEPLSSNKLLVFVRFQLSNKSVSCSRTGPFSTFLEPSCASLGPSGAVLGPSWARLGPFWGLRVPCCALLGPLRGHLVLS